MGVDALLYKTYNNIAKEKGSFCSKDLLQVGQTTRLAHITVIIDQFGSFQAAEFVDKKMAETPIPVTIESEVRTSYPFPHPLHDKLKFLAGDYSRYCKENNTKPHQEYMENLKSWCDSPYANPKIKAVYLYLNKGKLIQNLVEAGMFSVDENGRLTKKWGNLRTVKLTVGDQPDAFIRFSVTGVDDIPQLWKDKELQKQFSEYYLSTLKEEGFCYVTGKNGKICKTHPGGIRWSGDFAKIISSNSSAKELVWSGRFQTPEQAYTISYEASQKIHNALKWLVKNKGVRIGDCVFILWGIDGESTPFIGDSMVEAVNRVTDFNLAEPLVFDTLLDHYFNSYMSSVTNNSHYVIMGLDAATKGKLSIVYHQEYFGFQCKELIQNMKNWYKHCAWENLYYLKGRKNGYYMYGSPSLKSILKVVPNTRCERLVPCVCDGKPVPSGIIQSLLKKACYPEYYKNYSEWNQVVSVACALINYQMYKDSSIMAVDGYKDRSAKDGGSTKILDISAKSVVDIEYILGQVIAIYDHIESIYLIRSKIIDRPREKSTSNSIVLSMFSKFRCNPCGCINKIAAKILYYEGKIGLNEDGLPSQYSELVSKIDPYEFEKVRGMGAKFLLGFATQRIELYKEDKNDYEL